MAIKSPSERQFEEVQEKLKAQLPEAPPPINTEPVLDLGGRFWVIGGRGYWASPLSYPDGVRIADMYMRFQDHSKYIKDSRHALIAYENDIDEVTKMMWKFLEPESRVEKVLKKLGLARNPLKKANEGTIAELLSFFWLSRMSANAKSY